MYCLNHKNCRDKDGRSRHRPKFVNYKFVRSEKNFEYRPSTALLRAFHDIFPRKDMLISVVWMRLS